MEFPRLALCRGKASCIQLALLPQGGASPSMLKGNGWCWSPQLLPGLGPGPPLGQPHLSPAGSGGPDVSEHGGAGHTCGGQWQQLWRRGRAAVTQGSAGNCGGHCGSGMAQLEVAGAATLRPCWPEPSRRLGTSRLGHGEVMKHLCVWGGGFLEAQVVPE